MPGSGGVSWPCQLTQYTAFHAWRARRGLRWRTGFRNAAMSAGVRVTQRGLCGVCWTYSSCPARHQSAMVPTSTFRSSAAARAEWPYTNIRVTKGKLG
jgi:hypothetical protein